MKLSAKIVTIFETLLVIVLAAIVVIYAQVLWAQYMEQRSAQVIQDGTPVATPDEDEAELDAYTSAQRAKVAQDLALPSARPLPPEERQAVYDTLQATDAEPSMTDAERDAIIKSLNQ